jgi:hypothetical protein
VGGDIDQFAHRERVGSNLLTNLDAIKPINRDLA